jgi:cell filamentation protein
MSSFDGGNLYEYPNDVLRNKFSIMDAEELKRVEATLTAIRIAQLDEHPIPGRFDLDHLKAIHHHIFQDVYEWAGELRRVDISKESSWFAHFAFIESNANALLPDFAREHHLRGLPADQFTARAAYYLGELNTLHPFRDGNGRTQRAFLSALVCPRLHARQAMSSHGGAFLLNVWSRHPS